MELNKIDSHFKEQLNSREIKPSEMAWGKLDAMLSETEKPKRKHTWLYVAASFVGFLLIGSVFFNQNKNTIDVKRNNIVIENTIQKDSSKTEIKPIIKKLNVSKSILKQETEPLAQTQKNSTNNIESKILKSKEKVLTEIEPNKQIKAIAVTETQTQVKEDALLALVENNSKSEINKSSIKINPTTLLNEVDGELQLSFREKAFNTIFQKYKVAKEVVVNRNNQ